MKEFDMIKTNENMENMEDPDEIKSREKMKILNKIKDIFNRLQKVIIKFDDLTFSNEFTSFEIYQLHITAVTERIKDNLFGILAISLFKELFEDENCFKEYSPVKEEYLISLIKFYESGKNLTAESILIRKIMKILSDQKKPELRRLINLLKNEAKIDIEFIYLLLVYLIVKGYTISNLNKFLVPILENKFPNSDFIFRDVGDSDIPFKDFIEKLYKIKFENFYISKWDKHLKDIIIQSKSIDDIYNNILSIPESHKKEKTKLPKDKISDKSEICEKKLDKSDININDINNKNYINDKSNVNDKNDVNDKIYNNINGEIDSNNGVNDKSQDGENRIDIISLKKEETQDLKRKRKKNKKDNIIEINEKSINISSKEVEKESEKENINEKIKKMNEEWNIKFQELKNENKRLIEENNILSKRILKNEKEIKELQYIIKVIGLRDVFKIFIDFFIYIFNLKEDGSIKNKFNEIKNNLK